MAKLAVVHDVTAPEDVAKLAVVHDVTAPEDVAKLAVVHDVTAAEDVGIKCARVARIAPLQAGAQPQNLRTEPASSATGTRRRWNVPVESIADGGQLCRVPSQRSL